MKKNEELMELAFRFAAMTRRTLLPPPPPDVGCADPLPPPANGLFPPSPPPMIKGDKKRCHGKFRVLFSLLETDGVTQMQIVNRLGVRAASLSETIAKLEEEGLLERRPNENDRRQRFVYITEKGREACAGFKKRKSEMAESFFAPLTEDEKEDFFRILSKLIDR